MLTRSSPGQGKCMIDITIIIIIIIIINFNFLFYYQAIELNKRQGYFIINLLSYKNVGAKADALITTEEKKIAQDHISLRSRFIKNPKDIVIKARLFNTHKLMDHGLFAKNQPILFGGAALTIHHYKSKNKQWNRQIDDMDFYVTEQSAYDEFKNKRKIDFQNKVDKRLHFFQKLDDNFYIKVTVCLCPQWKNKSYERLYDIKVLTLKELKIFKMVGKYFDINVCQYYKRGNSPTKYFVRKAKKGKDIDDIFLINCLLNNGDTTK